MFNDFIHLHNHSEYSLLDGYSSIDKYVEALQKLGQKGMAITDHGNMHGVIEFYRKMRKANLKPILGEEFYICAWDTNIQHRVRDFDHMVLLAQTQHGYQNMMKLSSIANTLGFYYKGRIDFDLLAANNEGIIATSGCAAAPIFSSLLEGKLELADKITKWMKEVFGKRFYIELQWHPGLPEHNIHIKELIELGRKYEVETIITNDSHYAFGKDAPIQDLLLCLQMNKRVNDPDRMKFSDGEYYAKSATELRQNLQGYLEDSKIDHIFKTTCEIAESCECNPEGDVKPKIPYVETYNVNIDEFLADLAKKKMDEMFGGAANLQLYLERLDEELDVIKKTKFAAYFLIIDDICRHAKEIGISWNTRGSAAGSLVFYVLGVSFVDPIKNNLLFSRFLNEYRISIPDCDLDFPDSRRKEIIEYIVQKYGEDYTAQIVTFGRMKARMAVRDVGRALGIWKDDVDLIAKSIKNTPGKPITIANSLDPESEYYSADFLAHYNKTKNAKTIIDYAFSLETTTRHTGVHAAAVLISDKPLVDYVPLQRGGNSATTKHISQIDYPTCESIGLLKVDCLGLSTLSIIDLSCELINSRHNTKLNYMNVPYEESSSYDLLCVANCIGVFQVENQGLRKALAQLQPRTFTQVADMISLYRPGPIGYIPEYIEQTHHPKHIEYRHQLLQDIIGPTAGIMIYQEQVNQVLIKLAGYAPGEADLVRKSISKKDVAKIDKNRKVFIEGCAKNGIDKKTAELIHDDIEKFALYGFNRCSSGDTIIVRRKNANAPLTIEQMYRIKNDKQYALEHKHEMLHYKYKQHGYGCALSMNDQQRIVNNKIVDIRYEGKKDVYKVVTLNGHFIKCTDNHKIPTTDGIKLLKDIKIGDKLYICGQHEKRSLNYRWNKEGEGGALITPNGFMSNPEGGWFKYQKVRQNHIDNKSACEICSCESKRYELHHKDGNSLNNENDNLIWLCVSCHKKTHYRMGRTKQYERGLSTTTDMVTSIEYIGVEDVYDVEMSQPNHNFVVNNGLVICNSHASSYARITLITAWLKANYPIEYLTACLQVEGTDEVKRAKYVNDAKRNGIAILPPKLGNASENFYIDGTSIRFGFSNIKGVGDKASAKLAKVKTVADISKLKLNQAVIEALVAGGTFDDIVVRKFALNNILELTQYLATYNKVENTGQRAFTYPDIVYNNKTPAPVARFEKEHLGVWLENHPLDKNRRQYDNMELDTSIDIPSYDDNEAVRMMGAVQDVREVLTKKGDKMAFVTLSDYNGFANIVVFPKVYKEIEGGIQPNQVLYLTGKVQHGEEDSTVLAQNIKIMKDWQ